MKAAWWVMMFLWGIAVVALTLAPLRLVFLEGRSLGALALLVPAAVAGGLLLFYAADFQTRSAINALRVVSLAMWMLTAASLVFGPLWLVFGAGASLWSFVAVPFGLISAGFLFFWGDSLGAWK